MVCVEIRLHNKSFMASNLLYFYNRRIVRLKNIINIEIRINEKFMK